MPSRRRHRAPLSDATAVAVTRLRLLFASHGMSVRSAVVWGVALAVAAIGGAQLKPLLPPPGWPIAAMASAVLFVLAGLHLHRQQDALRGRWTCHWLASQPAVEPVGWQRAGLLLTFAAWWLPVLVALAAAGVPVSAGLVGACGGGALMLEIGVDILQIVFADIILSGDNALVIGMAASGLSPELRRHGAPASRTRRCGGWVATVRVFCRTGRWRNCTVRCAGGEWRWRACRRCCWCRGTPAQRWAWRWC